MKIHEYQAKALFREFGVPVPAGKVAEAPEEAGRLFEELAVPRAVIKAQIHAGGRGKGTFREFPNQHGVQLVTSPEEAKQVAGRMLGHTLVTAQTGPEGRVVRRVLIEEAADVTRELYMGMVVDRQRECPVILASAAGGMDIETVAATQPEAIFYEPVDVSLGVRPYQGRKLSQKLGLGQGDLARQLDAVLRGISTIFVEKDCSLVEINPLGVTADGRLLAMDAKINFDDNAAFRHPEWKELLDVYEEDPIELRASEAGLSYVKLDGDIGCLVNGAGLAMSTMDLIMLHGGRPANFLDVGGGADLNQVIEAFRILLADSKVKAVLVNIFGGIMRCSTIAQALVEAHRTVGITVPVVVRLEGNEVEQGRKILADSGLAIIPANDLTDAAQKVVAAAAGR
ncbi:ADP-forming succinate--CoA ligase subunit beta [Thermogutta sp.]|uniref:ADP-forming succinate--CoA ligase subunit beta n=1 Tax=Thermogutta sp. TaxID=1962930 RepID=UPI00322025B0